MSSDGTNLVFTDVTDPFDLAFDGPCVIVTHNFWTNLTRIDSDIMGMPDRRGWLVEQR